MKLLSGATRFERPLALLSQRALYATSSRTIDPLISLLLRNPELSPSDAENELRWIRQDARASVQLKAIDILGIKNKQTGLGADDRSRRSPGGVDGGVPGVTDVEMFRGIEEGLVLGLVERRAKGEPIQYILGSTDFGRIEILCRAPTLIPRPETAAIFSRVGDTLLSNVLSSTREGRQAGPLRILDMCTGTGCVPLLISHLQSNGANGSDLPTKFLGVDISSKAVSLAKENAARLGISNVTFDEMDIFQPVFTEKVTQKLGGRPALITANPPYISRDEWATLPASVKEHEDPAALLGDPKVLPSSRMNGRTEEDGKGLTFYHRISDILVDLLAVDDATTSSFRAIPRVVLEIGHKQAPDVQAILLSSGIITRTEVWQDQYSRDRAVAGYIDPT